MAAPDNSDSLAAFKAAKKNADSIAAFRAAQEATKAKVAPGQKPPVEAPAATAAPEPRRKGSFLEAGLSMAGLTPERREPFVGAVKSAAGLIPAVVSMGAGGSDPVTERVMRQAQSGRTEPVRPTVEAQKAVVDKGLQVFEPKTKGEKVGYYLESGVELAALPLALFSGLKAARAGIKMAKAAEEMIEQFAKRGVALSDEQIKAVRAGQKLKLTVEQVKAATAATTPTAAADGVRVTTQKPVIATAKQVENAAAVKQSVEGAQSVPFEKYAGDSTGNHTGVNLERLNVSDEAKQLADDVAAQTPSDVGAPITLDEVAERAAKVDPNTKPITRETMLENEARDLATRQQYAGLLEKKAVTTELLAAKRIVGTHATAAGRQLGAYRNAADPSDPATAMDSIIGRLQDMGRTDDEIAAGFKGVDWDNSNAVIDAFRKVSAPRNATEWFGYLREVLDEWRYGNMLSSPKTHIVNVTSTATNVALRPVVHLGSGAIDYFASALPGREQTKFVSAAPAYVRGAVNGIVPAAKAAFKRLKGDASISHADLGKFIPTRSRVTAAHRFVSRVLDAEDVLLREIAKAGEIEAALTNVVKQGKTITDVKKAEVAAKALEDAIETVFRKPLDTKNKSGQGYVLTAADNVTSGVQQLLNKIPMGRWFAPFVVTPANIAKQGLEWGPAGFVTLAGSARKAEQAAKATAGSMVFLAAGAMALEGRTTWGMPKTKAEMDVFRAAGRQPYSILVGDKWVGYSKLGPLAFPIALAAAAKYYGMDNPKTAGKGNWEKLGATLAGQLEFFGDQSYVQSLGDLMDAVQGDDPYAWRKVASAVPRQMVAFGSLLRWTNNMIDPVYRKAKGIKEQVTVGIPFLSESAMPYTDEDGKPSMRPMPGANAISPAPISPSNPDSEAAYQAFMEDARIAAEERDLEKKLEEEDERAIYEATRKKKRNGLKSR